MLRVVTSRAGDHAAGIDIGAVLAIGVGRVMESMLYRLVTTAWRSSRADRWC